MLAPHVSAVVAYGTTSEAMPSVRTRGLSGCLCCCCCCCKQEPRQGGGISRGGGAYAHAHETHSAPLRSGLVLCSCLRCSRLYASGYSINGAIHPVTTRHRRRRRRHSTNVTPGRPPLRRDKQALKNPTRRIQERVHTTAVAHVCQSASRRRRRRQQCRINAGVHAQFMFAYRLCARPCCSL